ncbi:MAG: hypothetical protein JNM66_05375 [Bryobacterales bacterium]|nr:hypothetical protein [Bryobacterales bacterium]
MATPAQSLANAANAQHSTGPRTEAGKARSARNATTHGFTTGVLVIKPEDRPLYDSLKQGLIAENRPEGALEMDALQEFLDAAWRLRQIRVSTRELFLQHNEDPFTHPETAAAMRQLTRYRAAAEMQLHRALGALRDLQTLRLGRTTQLAESEFEAIGPLAAPKTYAFAIVDGIPMAKISRDRFDTCYGITDITRQPRPFGPPKKNDRIFFVHVTEPPKAAA